jgi:hypothetical protein
LLPRTEVLLASLPAHVRITAGIFLVSKNDAATIRRISRRNIQLQDV